ncbi:alpha/beta fold hydrolase [Pseudonocardia pini]|uniref:alpha/beta fold hydrolase n=1 Tax=Pseudonocardia pini TaxID=2758030 RepID=UPI0015F1238E|nr:alpha/beta hydrolase [Pseudonocardia pini]
MTAPAWFTQALATPSATAVVEVDGAAARYLTAGPEDGAPLVFVHGGTAHAHWWWPVAARFAGTHRIVVPDLSGHGTSDHREQYSFEGWAAELAAVIGHALPGARPVLVGHSIGGLVCLALAAERRDLVSGLVLCDTLLADPGAAPAPVGGRHDGPPRPAPTYASVAEATARFRTIPPQEDYAGYVLGHVVPRSLRPTGDRWTWRFDRGILAQFDETVALRAWPWLRRLRCPLGYLRSEHGLTPRAVVSRLVEEIPSPVILGEVPGAGHHAMLDRPDELFLALERLLSTMDGTQGQQLSTEAR